ncbi:MAG TPA: neutral zinc metallopeptidase [Hyphomicrobiaceae bacterium]|nr:neutral zinc metallopeptidase [Hyphomicrobiaceae bacterium]
MRYGPGDRESDQVEDRRGEGDAFPGRFPGGARIRIPIGGAGGRGLGLGTLVLIGVACLLLGINPLTLLTDGGIEVPLPDMGGRPSASRPGVPDTSGPRRPGTEQASDEMATFVRRVLADSEDVWGRVFANAGKQYQKPKLVLFTTATRTACGTGESAMGPFYCPLDHKVYIDLAFYDDLKRRFGAPGDFAQAYVIAHEVGHHVQTLLGIADQVQAEKRRATSQAEANAVQVRMELQADCFAGVWAALNHQTKARLEPGDIEEGLTAAAAIGDDTLQRKMQGHVVPDAFTHGSSAQRVRWFKRGLETGQTKACDTFNASEL